MHLNGSSSDSCVRVVACPTDLCLFVSRYPRLPARKWLQDAPNAPDGMHLRACSVHALLGTQAVRESAEIDYLSTHITDLFLILIQSRKKRLPLEIIVFSVRVRRYLITVMDRLANSHTSMLSLRESYLDRVLQKSMSEDALRKIRELCPNLSCLHSEIDMYLWQSQSSAIVVLAKLAAAMVKISYMEPPREGASSRSSRPRALHVALDVFGHIAASTRRYDQSDQLDSLVLAESVTTGVMSTHAGEHARAPNGLQDELKGAVARRRGSRGRRKSTPALVPCTFCGRFEPKLEAHDPEAERMGRAPRIAHIGAGVCFAEQVMRSGKKKWKMGRCACARCNVRVTHGEERAAYCSSTCQTSDWRAHKRQV